MTVRGRFLLAFGLAAVVVGAGVASERVVGVRAPAGGDAGPALSGAWFCPHGGGEGWRSWVVVANPGRAPVDIRLTSLVAGSAVRDRDRVEPGTHRFFPVPAGERAAATTVESFGGRVAASMVTTRPDGGLGADPCAGHAGPRWFVAEGSTVEGSGAEVVIVNPFAEPAVVDLALHTEDRVVETQRLSGVVVKPRRVVAFNLNEFALGEEPLTVAVRASLGKVAVAGLAVGEGALRSVLAVPAPARRWILPAAGDAGSTDLVVLAPGRESVPFRVRAQGEEGQEVLVDDGSVAGRVAETFELDAPGAGLVAEADGPAAFVAGRRLRSGAEPAEPREEPPPRRDRRGDRDRRPRPEPPPPPPPDAAGTAGAPAGSRSWVALPATPPAGGRSLLILENPTAADVTASVRLLTADGPADLGEVRIPSGRSAVVDLTAELGEGPVAAAVTADGPMVAAQAAQAPQGYALSLAVPF